MTDIPKMLRAEALIADEDWTGIYGISPNLAYAAADRIEKLERALAHIYAWYPISVSGPIQTIHEIRDHARKALEGKDD